MANIEPGTIYIDDRVGSADLADYFPPETVHVTRLDYGDAMFGGFGPDNSLLQVGIEIKAIGDLITSIENGRLVGHQLPGLQEYYNVVYLIIEGLYRVDMDTDHIQTFAGHWRDYSFGNRVWLGKGLESWQISMEMLAGLKIRTSTSRADSARVISSLYHWFTKEWDQHTALNVINKSQIQRKASLLRTIASVLPGIGWKRSGAVERHFPTVRAMVNAPVEDWTSIDGIGEGIARKIIQSLGDNRP
jgi:ERCC4-type nuclease